MLVLAIGTRHGIGVAVDEVLDPAIRAVFGFHSFAPGDGPRDQEG
jgi:hypothetical protein